MARGIPFKENTAAMSSDELKMQVKKAEALCEKKLWVEALPLAESLIVRWPGEMLPYYVRGRVKQGMGDNESALKDLGKAIAMDPNYAKTHHYRGNALDDMKRYDEALAAYDRAIIIEPKFVNAYNGKGNALRNLKRYEEALATYERAIKWDSIGANAHNNKGIVLDDLKRYDEALESYDQAIKINPNVADFYNNKGITLCSLKRYDEALSYYNRAIKINDNNYLFYYNRADCYEKMGRKNEALADYNTCLILKPSYTSAQYWRDKLQEKMHRRPQAPKGAQTSSVEIVEKIHKTEAAISRFRADEEKRETWSATEVEKLGDLPIKLIRRFHEDPLSKAINEASEKKKEDFAAFTTYKFTADSNNLEFHVLRRWNSYTPIVANNGISSRGGGYFLCLGNTGIVIDPGFDFIKNFMEAGFVFSQIGKVFITHAHNDHDADLESILTLLYVYNKDVRENIIKKLIEETLDNKIDGQDRMTENELYNSLKLEKAKRYCEQRKVIDIYLSISAFKKHDAKLKLSQDADYHVHVVDTEHFPIDCGKGVYVTPIPAKHFDLISDCDALGFVIESDKSALVYTGDTGYTPEIGAVYRDLRKKYEKKEHIALLAHLGGFKKREDNLDEIHLRSGEAFYKDHLGRNGMICLVHDLCPECCILSEFGEEFDGRRKDLAQLFTAVFTFPDHKIPFIPADIGLCLNGEMMIKAIQGMNIDDKNNVLLDEPFIEPSAVCATSIIGVDSLVYLREGIKMSDNFADNIRRSKVKCSKASEPGN